MGLLQRLVVYTDVSGQYIGSIFKKMEAITCPETSVINYQTLLEIQEGRRYLLTRGGTLKSRIFLCYHLITTFRLHRKYSIQKMDFFFFEF